MAKIKLASILETPMVSDTETPVDTGGEKPAKKVMVSVKKKDGDVIGDEMKILYNRPLRYDNNQPASQIVNSAAKKMGVNPSLLFSSSFQEGMNKAIAKPDEVSEAYLNANSKGDLKDYPVDGFYNYGLDTFGQKLDRIKKYLPAGFEQQYKVYDAQNEKNMPIKTVAFKNNEAALIAKSAMLKDVADTVDSMAVKKGIKLDDKARNYFTLAAYNGGEGNANQMMDEYLKAKDKNDFIDNGRTTRQGVHKNISPRLKRMQLADELLISK